MFVLQSIDFHEVETLVKEAAGLFSNNAAAARITAKGRADFVTEVDLAVQRTLCGKLAEKYPMIQFMGEEKDNRTIDFERPVWILDPVDGTTNLIHHFPENCISLALAEQHEVVAGMIYNPWMEELFFAVKGQGAVLNGKPIHVSDSTSLADSLVSVGTTPYSHEYADSVFSQIKDVFLRAQDIRRLGSAAMDLAYVACGRVDAYFEQFLKPWDFAAGMLIVREAGGEVTDYRGELISPEHPQPVLATNGKIHEELIKVLDAGDLSVSKGAETNREVSR
ncbi:MAG: inositol monophosphatase [Clostridiales bacterium]|nr:inositol monophosphatase [Clostridiales bacterium]